MSLSAQYRVDPFQPDAISSQTHGQCWHTHEKTRKNFFPLELHGILNMSKFASILSWTEGGNSIIIKDAKKFSEKILSNNFYKKGNLNSFTRKMHRWGFRMLAQGPNAILYSHPLFLREMPWLSKKMSCTPRRVKSRANLNSNEAFPIEKEAHNMSPEGSGISSKTPQAEIKQIFPSKQSDLRQKNIEMKKQSLSSEPCTESTLKNQVSYSKCSRSEKSSKQVDDLRETDPMYLHQILSAMLNENTSHMKKVGLPKYQDSTYKQYDWAINESLNYSSSPSHYFEPTLAINSMQTPLVSTHGDIQMTLLLYKKSLLLTRLANELRSNPL